MELRPYCLVRYYNSFTFYISFYKKNTFSTISKPDARTLTPSIARQHVKPCLGSALCSFAHESTHWGPAQYYMSPKIRTMLAICAQNTRQKLEHWVNFSHNSSLLLCLLINWPFFIAYIYNSKIRETDCIFLTTYLFKNIYSRKQSSMRKK